MGADNEPVIGEDGMSMMSSTGGNVARVPEPPAAPAPETEIHVDPEQPTMSAPDPSDQAPMQMATGDTESREPLLAADAAGSFRQRWERIQSRFVDDPQNSVELADELVTEVVRDLQASFVSERQTLEAQWQRGDDVETEDLRMALKRYRSFFDRLLSA